MASRQKPTTKRDPTAKVKKYQVRAGPSPQSLAPTKGPDATQLFQELTANLARWGLGGAFGRTRLANPDELVGRKGLRIYTAMRTDDQVHAAMKLKKHAVLSTGWNLRLPDTHKEDSNLQRATEMVKWNFQEGLDGNLDDDLMEILSALEFGVSVTELCWQPLTISISRDWVGKIGLKKLATRRPHDFTFAVDPHDNLLPNGIEQFGRPFPVDRFVIYTPNKEFDNWYGVSDLRAAYRCYSDDTRVLTRDGWRLFSELKPKQEMAALDPVTGRMEYHKLTNVFHYRHQGKMFHQGGRFIDLLVTPNHRMWVAKGHRQPYKFNFIEAQDLLKIIRYKRDADWGGQEQEWFEVPAVTIRQRVSNQTGRNFGARETARPARRIRMDDWLRFFGVWLAEGWTTRIKQSVIGLCQKEGPKARRIAEWVAACGFHAGERNREGLVRFEITDKQLYEYLIQFGKSHDKFIPRGLLGLSRRQLRILYQAMMLGDGSRNGYATVSDRLADDMAELILKAGWAPTKHRDSSENRLSENGAVWIIHANKRNIGATVCNEHADQRSLVDYAGDVWCAEVPPHHLLYVERNGKACWSGNSWWFKDNCLKWWGIFMDRYSVPLGVGTYPRNLDLRGTEVPDLRTILDSLQAATSITMPNDYKLEFPAPASAQGAAIFERAVQVSDMAIARALLLPNLLGVSAQGDMGSYSQARKQFDVFILVIEKLQRDLSEIVMGSVIKRLCDLNFDLEAYPEFYFLPFTESNKGELLGMFNQAVAAGVAVPRPQDEVHVRSMTEFPEVPLEDIQAESEAAKAKEAGGAGGPGGLFGPAEVPGGSGTEVSPGGGEGEMSDEELDALIGEALGGGGGEGGGAEHPLTAKVADALGAKGVKVFAKGDGAIEISRADISAALERLAADNPDWDDDQLVEEIAAQLAEGGGEEDAVREGRGADEGAGEAGEEGGVAGEGDLADEDLDALIDEVLGEAAPGEPEITDEELRVLEAKVDELLGPKGATPAREDPAWQAVRDHPEWGKVLQGTADEHPDWNGAELRAELERRLSGKSYAFDEAEHPRESAGSEKGGEFAPKGGGSGGVAAGRAAWEMDQVEFTRSSGHQKDKTIWMYHVSGGEYHKGQASGIYVTRDLNFAGTFVTPESTLEMIRVPVAALRESPEGARRGANLFMESLAQESDILERRSAKVTSSTYEGAREEIKNPHKMLVRQALAEGKLVPPEVLEEYPELRRLRKFAVAWPGLPDGGGSVKKPFAFGELAALDVFGPDGQRMGIIRETAGGLDLFGLEGERLGWGRCDAGGNCEIFGMDGRRIGTITRDKVIRYAFDEAEHPREPAGSETGGQFAPAGGGEGVPRGERGWTVDRKTGEVLSEYGKGRPVAEDWQSNVEDPDFLKHADKDVAIVHTHPDESSFSDTDWVHMGWGHVSMMQVSTKSGRVLTLKKSADFDWRKATPRRIRELWGKFEEEVFADPKFSERTAEDMIEEINHRMAAATGIRYSTDVPLLAAVKKKW